jgi:hypothetical protein
MVPCVARTFLPDETERWNSLLLCKVNYLTRTGIKDIFIFIFAAEKPGLSC